MFLNQSKYKKCPTSLLYSLLWFTVICPVFLQWLLVYRQIPRLITPKKYNSSNLLAILRVYVQCESTLIFSSVFRYSSKEKIIDKLETSSKLLSSLLSLWTFENWWSDDKFTYIRCLMYDCLYYRTFYVMDVPHARITTCRSCHL